MFCVIQTPDFDNSAKRLKLSDGEVHSIVTQLSENPNVGDLIVGTGGARKWRVPIRGKGKSSGYRVISYYSAEDVPVFLLDIFSKGEKINLSQRERNQLKTILGGIAEDYRLSVQRKVTRLKENAS
jgi:hypothetical protein